MVQLSSSQKMKETPKKIGNDRKYRREENLRFGSIY